MVDKRPRLEDWRESWTTNSNLSMLVNVKPSFSIGLDEEQKKSQWKVNHIREISKFLPFQMLRVDTFQASFIEYKDPSWLIQWLIDHVIFFLLLLFPFLSDYVSSMLFDIHRKENE